MVGGVHPSPVVALGVASDRINALESNLHRKVVNVKGVLRSAHLVMVLSEGHLERHLVSVCLGEISVDAEPWIDREDLEGANRGLKLRKLGRVSWLKDGYQIGFS